MSKFNRLEDISRGLFSIRTCMYGDISDRQIILLLIEQMQKLIMEIQDDDV